MWLERDNALSKEFVFADFIQAFAWMSMIAIEAEKMQHHPEWTNVYNRVIVTLATHDAGNTVTQADRSLARVMDERYQQISIKNE